MMARDFFIRCGRPSTRRILLVVALLVGAVDLAGGRQQVSTPARSPAQRLEEAITLMDSRGDYAAAAKVFAELAAGRERPVAARALVYLGACSERQGLAEAAKYYRRVLTEFRDQPAAVREAEKRLAALPPGEPRGAPSTVSLAQAWPAEPAMPLGFMGQLSSGANWLAIPGKADIVVAEIHSARPVHKLTAKRDNEGEGAVDSCVPSPDGFEAAYVWQSPGRPREIRIASLRERQPRVLMRLAEGQDAFLWHWSPAGSILASIDRNGEPSDLSLVSVSDGRVVVVARTPTMPGAATVSPDGRFVCFDGPAEPGATRSGLFVARAAGGPAMPLLSDTWSDSGPVWSPKGGSFVLFISNRSGMDSLCLVPVSDGKPSGRVQVLHEGLGRIAAPLGLSADGAYYYYRQVGLTSVYTLALNKEAWPAGEPQNQNLGDKLTPGFGRPGGRPALALAPTLGGALVIRDLERGTERAIATDMQFVRWPQWSADGRSILLRGADGQNNLGNHLLDVETGHVAPIPTPTPAEDLGRVRWDRRGRGLVYLSASVVRPNVTIRSREVEGNRSETLAGFALEPTRRLAAFELSPTDDSLALVLAEPGAATLALRAPDGAMREVLRVAAPDLINGLAWMPDGRHLLVVRASPEARISRLWRVTVDSGRAEPLAVAMEGLRDLAVSPDGHLAAFVSGWPKREVWTLSNFLPASVVSTKLHDRSH